MRAMVVDDSGMLRMLVTKILKGAGYEVAEAADGRIALDKVRDEGLPDLIVLDWNMPVLDGYGFLVEFRKEAKHAAAKVILLTTEGQREKILKALEAGADDYITKPFEADALLTKVQRIMEAGDVL